MSARNLSRKRRAHFLCESDIMGFETGIAFEIGLESGFIRIGTEIGSSITSSFKLVSKILSNKGPFARDLPLIPNSLAYRTN